jgi:hypothetical protein
VRSKRGLQFHRPDHRDCHSAAIVSRSFGGLPAANDAKSVFETLNRTMPQSKQVTSCASSKLRAPLKST